MEVAARRGPRPPRERLATLQNRNSRLRHRTPAMTPTRSPAPQSRCPECQGTDFQDVNGTAVCRECGVTINDSNIVAEVTFGESAAGAAMVQGGFVGEGQRHARTAGSGRYVHEQREPREVSEAHGRDEIRRQANRHNLSDHIVDQAVAIYKLALNHNFVQGRQIRVASAVCLYGACRRDPQNTTLLMDLAEGITVNVFRLGQAWTDLKKTLFLDDLKHRPVMEVENLIMKFARKLEFGDKLMKVAEDAARLLKRMKRDWMVTGRQPAGLCGACIILAARMNNFRRTVREVVYVVKVADLTVAKRLEEFGRTQSSNLTVEDFREKGLRLKVAHDPPALYESKIREEKKRKHDQISADAESESGQREESETVEGAYGNQQEGSAVVEKSDSSIRRSKRRRVAPRIDADGFAIPDLPTDSSATQSSQENDAASGSGASSAKKRKRTGASDDTNISRGLQKRTKASGINQDTQSSTSQSTTRKSRGRNRKHGDTVVDPILIGDSQEPENRAESTQATQESFQSHEAGDDPPAKKRKRGRTHRDEARQRFEITADDLLGEDELEEEMEIILNDPINISVVEEAAQGWTEEGEARAKALADSLREPESTSQPTVNEDPDIADDEFDDDPEVANCLLTEDERRVKEKIWVKLNEDWLRERQAKMLKKQLDEATGTTKKPRKKRKKGRMGDGSVLEGGPPVANAADATKRMLEKHVVNPSKHINYETVDRLYAEFRGGASSGGSESATRAGSVAASDTTDATSVVEAGAREHSRSASAVEARRGSEGLPTPAATAEGTRGMAAAGGEALSGNEITGEDFGDSDDDEDDEDEEEEEEEEDFRKAIKAAGMPFAGFNVDEDPEPEYDDEEDDGL